MVKITKHTEEQKLKTIINKNTFYFFNPIFEEKYESYLNSLKAILLLLQHEIKNKGLNKSIIEKILEEKENGLKALLALTGLSNETLKRFITIIRIANDTELNKLVYKDKWLSPQNTKINEVKEWSDTKITNLIKKDFYFRKGITNLFFEGSTIPFLTRTIPLFELKKLSISKLNFDLSEMIDTLICYKEKGSYSGLKENNPEFLIEEILNDSKISFEKGDLNKLIQNNTNTKRTMDFIIPNQENPLIIIECSFLATTSSGQGDKSKTEIAIDTQIKSYYPKAKFVGFIDGIGWYVRRGDLKRMITAYEDVFTFHKEELIRFRALLKATFSK